ncbi:MAG: hypothetical protein M3522_02360 [Actinomycetota bacterium]|nr:hypothetical protein [Actinomycetota bacterium]
MSRIAGYLFAGTALIACPCHLALTLPLALIFLEGTALGAAITAHTGLLVATATAYFVGALAAAVYLLNRPSKDEEPLRTETPRFPEEAGAQAHVRSRPAR